MTVESHWTLVSVKRNGNPQSRLMFSKNHTEIAMELAVREFPGIYAHFIVIETRKDERPIIHVFEQEKVPT